MKITLESVAAIAFYPNGQMLGRVWKGATETGKVIVAFIPIIGHYGDLPELVDAMTLDDINNEGLEMVTPDEAMQRWGGRQQ